MQNPFADLIPGQQAPKAGLVPLVPPDPNEARDAEQARILREIQIQQARRDLAKPDKLDEGGLTAVQRNALVERKKMLPGFERSINEIEALYRKNFEGDKGAILGVGGDVNAAGKWLPNWMRPENEQLQSAADSLIGTIASIEGATGGEMNSLAELRARFGPMLPAPGDSDQTIKDKIARLRAKLEDQRGVVAAQLGEDPAGLAAQPSATVAAPGDIGFAGKDALEPTFTPAQQAAYDAWWSVNPDPTPQQLEAFGLSIGAQIRNAEEIIRAKKEGLGVRSGNDAVLAPPDIADRRNEGELSGEIEAAARGAADSLTLGLSPRLFALSNTIQNGGTYEDNLRRERAIDEYDTENNFGQRVGGQLVGGVGLPSFGASTAKQLATLGGAYGAGYGFNSSDGTMAERLVAAGTGGAIGAGGGAAFGLIGNHIGSRGGGSRLSPDRSDAIDLAAAARRQNVDIFPADVGGPVTRRLTAGAAQSPISAGTIVRAGERTLNQSAAARDRIAATVGQAVDPSEAGEAAIRGAQSYRKLSGEQGRRLYDGASGLAGDTRIDPAGARAILDRNIAELAESPTGAPATLTKLREQLNGDFTVAGLRNLRTSLRDEFAAQGLRGTDTERRGMQAVDALTDDIATGLTAQGNSEAAQAYRAADQAWRKRLEVIDDVIAPIIGRNGEKSGEQVFQAIQTASRSNTSRLNAFMKTIPAEEQDTVRATIIGNLGRSSSGTQNADGTAFSLNQFLTHWNQMTPRAKEVLFKGESRAALDDLAKVAQGSREASTYANRSNTSGSQIGNVLTGGVGVAAWFEPIFLTALATNYGAGKLLASPRFARFLARPPTDKARAIKRLGQIASREPALAPDILPLQQALEGGAARAAAAEQEENPR